MIDTCQGQHIEQSRYLFRNSIDAIMYTPRHSAKAVKPIVHTVQLRYSQCIYLQLHNVQTHVAKTVVSM
jgi:hypothetical protein